MKPSAKQNILTFLQSNKGVFHNGELQRMVFKNKNGSQATGDTIKRRLQNLAEENKIHVSYRGGEAHYSANYIEPVKKPEYRIVDLPDGSRVAQMV